MQNVLKSNQKSMKNLLFISKPKSWGNISVQVRQTFVFNNTFCGDYPFFNFLINPQNAKRKSKHKNKRGTSYHRSATTIARPIATIT